MFRLSLLTLGLIGVSAALPFASNQNGFLYSSIPFRKTDLNCAESQKDQYGRCKPQSNSTRGTSTTGSIGGSK